MLKFKVKKRTKIDVFAFNVNKKESQTWRKKNFCTKGKPKNYILLLMKT
ncbi:hypothetical protein CU022_1548 [Enterococcus faecium]|nr:hypothetical protein [Enterococcus faecium]MBK4849805.1 hypothetical protein [Enterococcus faecium]